MKFLMVCLGNICRSPMAEGILQSKLNQENFVDSCGTGAYHIGDAPDKRAIKVSAKHNIDISELRARQFQLEDFDNFDRIYCMDTENYNDLYQLTDDPIKQAKLKMLLDENPKITNKNVPDPYYGDIADFEYVYDLLDESINYLVQNLKNA